MTHRAHVRGPLPSAPLARALAGPLLVAIGLCGIVSGCSVGSGPTSSARSADEEIALWIEMATETDASDSQMAILERAQERDGVVTAADVDEAYQETLRCYEDAGLDYKMDWYEATTGSNIKVPAAVIVEPKGATETEAMQIADVAAACEDLHHIWVASAYLNQPSSRQAQDAVWQSETVIRCLEDRGYAFPDNVSSDDVRQAEHADLAKNQANPNYPGRCVPNQG